MKKYKCSECKEDKLIKELYIIRHTEYTICHDCMFWNMWKMLGVIPPEIPIGELNAMAEREKERCES